VSSGTLSQTGAITQYSGGTLAGGTWKAFANSTLKLTPGASAVVTTNASALLLDGSGSSIITGSAGTADLQDSVTSITATGSLTVQNGAVFTPPANLSNAGVLAVNAGGAFNVAAVIAPVSGLTNRWLADGTAVDQAGGANGTLENGAGFTSGIEGQAFNFDGVNDDVKIANASGLNIGTAFTIDVWIRANPT